MIVVRMNQDAVRGNKLFPAGLWSVGEDLSETNLDIVRIYITIEPFQSRGQWLCKFIEQKKKGSTPTGLVCNTNMAFFFVSGQQQTSCEYALYSPFARLP